MPSTVAIGRKEEEMEKLPALMTVQEFAELTRVNPVTIRRNCQQGKLPSIKVGGHWRIVTEKALDTERK